jgi:LCP family protein required for cell wall assembly
MDEFRAPSRPVRREGTLYDVPVRARLTQTPNENATQPVAPASTPVQPVAPTVNPSLTEAFGEFEMTPLQPRQEYRRLGHHQPVAHLVSPALPQEVPQFIEQPIAPSPPPIPTPQPIAPPVPQPIAAPLAPVAPVAPIAPPMPQPAVARDFSMPSPQAIAQEVQVVNESAEAAQAQEAQAVEQEQKPSPFDIATIEEEEKPKNRLSSGRQWRKWLMSGGIVGLSLLIAGGGLLFAQAFSNTNKVFRGTGQAAALNASADHVKLNGEDKGRVNFLLLGNGGLGHEAPDLTDTIIVASIDTVHKTAVMLSIPRDLWVQNNGTNPSKINAVYELAKYNEAGKMDNTNNNTKAVLAGFDAADKTVENVLGIDINYNVLVNFTSFKQAIDAVGGVTVNVPEQLYDPTMAWENGGNPVLAAAGTQQMNGTSALRYVRSRETSSDFARSQRQRSVILALKSKVLTAGTLSNPLKVSGLLNAMGDNLVTDMSLAEGMRAYDLTKAIDNAKVQTVDLVTPPNGLVTTTAISNASVAVPRAGTFEYGDIQKYVDALFNPPQTAKAGTTTTTNSTKAETANIAVLNGTTRAGLAGTRAATIKAAGYNVSQIGNAPSQGFAQTVVVDLGHTSNPKTRAYLESLYGVKATATLPDPSIPPGNADFVVILGSDQAH